MIRLLRIYLLAIFFATMLLTGCQPRTPSIGSEQNPISWVFIPSGQPDRVLADFNNLAESLHRETGLFIQPIPAVSYGDMLEIICEKPRKAQISSLPPFVYLLAHENGCADSDLIAVRNGSATYQGQIFARSDRGITTLQDLQGRIFCRPDPLSASGWIIPSITLRAAGVKESELGGILDAGSHDGAVIGVYTGECDAGSSYVDARLRVQAQFPDVLDKVLIIEKSPAIPNDGVQYSPDLPIEIQDKITKALLHIASTSSGKKSLQDTFQWDDLEPHGDDFYNPLRQVLERSGMSLEELAK